MKQVVFLFILQIALVQCDEESASGESGSGLESGGHFVEPSSGMLGDEIVPMSNFDNFKINSDDYDNAAMEKRGKITKAAKSSENGKKRFWQYTHPYYHWLNTQQQQQQTLQHSQPAGKCLDENSLCDVGHDEQCCGFASYCIDYWGVGKCLAFKQPAIYDKNIPARIHRNNLYKAQMRRMQYAATVGR